MGCLILVPTVLARGIVRDTIQSKPRTVPPFARALRLVSENHDRPPTSAAESDTDLVCSLRADRAGAPAMLWDRYSPGVRRLLERGLGSDVEIEDLTQEVFLRVFVRIRSLRDLSALRPFVFSVAANVLKWELRRRWVRRKVRLSETGVLPDVRSTTDDVEARQALRRCYGVFEALTANERAAFILRYMEEMTVEEVALTLSVSASTAKRLVNRAAAKVAEQVMHDRDLRSFFTDPEKGAAHES
jgi:RNA polymerase sigma factor (sigma-70 family)